MENGNDRRDQAEKHLKDTLEKIERNDRKLASTDENERILETRCESRDVRDESRAAVTRGGSGGEPIGDEFYTSRCTPRNRPFGRTLAYDFDHYVVYI